MKQLLVKSAPMGLVFILALLVVIETGFLIGGIIYYDTLSILDDQATSVTRVSIGREGPVVSPPESNLPLMDQWKEYSNPKIDFTFKYPPDVILKEGIEGGVVTLTKAGSTQKTQTEFFDGISLSFSKPFNLVGKTLKTYVDEQIALQTAVESKVIKPLSGVDINGLKGYSYTIEGLGTFSYFYLQSQLGTDNYVEIVNATVDPTNQGYQAVVDSILATLEFAK